MTSERGHIQKEGGNESRHLSSDPRPGIKLSYSLKMTKWSFGVRSVGAMSLEVESRGKKLIAFFADTTSRRVEVQ